jgi:hypothetical protein
MIGIGGLLLVGFGNLSFYIYIILPKKWISIAFFTKKLKGNQMWPSLQSTT